MQLTAEHDIARVTVVKLNGRVVTNEIFAINIWPGWKHWPNLGTVDRIVYEDQNASVLHLRLRDGEPMTRRDFGIVQWM